MVEGGQVGNPQGAAPVVPPGAPFCSSPPGNHPRGAGPSTPWGKGKGSEGKGAGDGWQIAKGGKGVQTGNHTAIPVANFWGPLQQKGSGQQGKCQYNPKAPELHQSPNALGCKNKQGMVQGVSQLCTKVPRSGTQRSGRWMEIHSANHGGWEVSTRFAKLGHCRGTPRGSKPSLVRSLQALA